MYPCVHSSKRITLILITFSCNGKKTQNIFLTVTFLYMFAHWELRGPISYVTVFLASLCTQQYTLCLDSTFKFIYSALAFQQHHKHLTYRDNEALGQNSGIFTIPDNQAAHKLMGILHECCITQWKPIQSTAGLGACSFIVYSFIDPSFVWAAEWSPIATIMIIPKGPLMHDSNSTDIQRWHFLSCEMGKKPIRMIYVRLKQLPIVQVNYALSKSDYTGKLCIT